VRFTARGAEAEQGNVAGKPVNFLLRFLGARSVMLASGSSSRRGRVVARRVRIVVHGDIWADLLQQRFKVGDSRFKRLHVVPRTVEPSRRVFNEALYDGNNE
jgi:hypothetical protein